MIKNNKFLLLSVLSILILLTFIACGNKERNNPFDPEYDGPVGNLKGKASTRFGEQIEAKAGIKVYIDSPNLKDRFVAYTNNDGVFTISNVPIGTYIIRAKFSDDERDYNDSVIYDVEVKENKTTLVNNNRSLLLSYAIAGDIAWISNRTGFDELWTMKSDGTHKEQTFLLSNNNIYYSIRDADYYYSDGNGRMLFTTGADTIYIYDIAADEVNKTTITGVNNIYSACWNKDATRIWLDDGITLYYVDLSANGEAKEKFSTNIPLQAKPAFSTKSKDYSSINPDISSNGDLIYTQTNDTDESFFSPYKLIAVSANDMADNIISENEKIVMYQSAPLKLYGIESGPFNEPLYLNAYDLLDPDRDGYTADTDFNNDGIADGIIIDTDELFIKTLDTRNVWHPEWSPDGYSIAFCDMQGTLPDNVRITHLNSTELTFPAANEDIFTYYDSGTSQYYYYQLNDPDLPAFFSQQVFFTLSWAQANIKIIDVTRDDSDNLLSFIDFNWTAEEFYNEAEQLNYYQSYSAQTPFEPHWSPRIDDMALCFTLGININGMLMESDLWLLEFKSGLKQQLTTDGNEDRNAVWIHSVEDYY